MISRLYEGEIASLRDGVGARILAYKACGLVLSYYFYLFRACGFSSFSQRILTRWFGSPRVASRFVSARIPIDSIIYAREKRRVSLFAAIHPGAFPSSLVVFVVTWRETTTRIVTVGNLTVKAKRLFRDISHRIVIRLLSDRRDLRETAICDSDTRTFIYKNIK